MKRLGAVLFPFVLWLSLVAVAQDTGARQPAGSGRSRTMQGPRATRKTEEHPKGEISYDWAFNSASPISGARSNAANYNYSMTVVGSGPPTSYPAQFGTNVTNLKFRGRIISSGGALPGGGTCAVSTGCLEDGSAFPLMGAANDCITDPDFNSTICQLVDQHTLDGLLGPGRNYDGFEMADNGESVAWNVNSTMFRLLKAGNGCPYVFAFDPQKTIAGVPNPNYMHAKVAIACTAYSPTNKQLFNSTHTNFSKQDPALLFQQPIAAKGTKIYESYVVDASGTPIRSATQTIDHLQCVNTSSPTCANGRDVVVDYVNNSSHCLLGPSQGLSSSYASNWRGTSRISNDDKVFGNEFAGGPDWEPDFNFSALADFPTVIMPKTNNSGRRQYIVQSGNVSGQVEPNWNATCPNVGETCNDGGGSGGITWKNIGPAFQGNGTVQVVWDLNNGGCRYWRTDLGKIVDGDFGDLGTITTGYTGSTPCAVGTSCGAYAIPPEYYLNDGTVAPNGSYLANGGRCIQGCTKDSFPAHWEIKTTNVRMAAQATDRDSGYDYDYRLQNGKAFLWHDPLNSNNCLFNQMNPCLPGVGLLDPDAHGTNLNTSSGEPAPVFWSTYDAKCPQKGTSCNSGKGPYVPYCGAGPYTCDSNHWGFFYEIIAQSTTGTPATPYRFASTFNDGNTAYGDVWAAIAVVSQDGLFALFPSTWMSTLGCTNGTPPPCAIQASTPEVFVVDLQSAH